MENAQLNLGFTKITSPIDGLAGTALAQIGDLVGQSRQRADDGFDHQSDQGIFSSQRAVLSGVLAASGRFGPGFPVAIDFCRRLGLSRKGKFFFADRQVDPNTGTLQIFGLFPNANFVLRPGQYGRVRAQTQT